MSSIGSPLSSSSSNNHLGMGSNGGHNSRDSSSSSLGSLGGSGNIGPPLNPGSIPLVGANTGADINKTINNLIDDPQKYYQDFKSFVDTFRDPAPQKQVLQDFLLMYDPANQDFLNSEIENHTQSVVSQSSHSSSMYVLDQLITYNRLEQEFKKPEADRVCFNPQTYNELKSTLKDSLESLKTADNKPMLCSACLYLGDDSGSDPMDKIKNGYTKIVSDEALTDEFVSEGFNDLEQIRQFSSSANSLFEQDGYAEVDRLNLQDASYIGEEWETMSDLTDPDSDFDFEDDQTIGEASQVGIYEESSVDIAEPRTGFGYDESVSSSKIDEGSEDGLGESEFGDKSVVSDDTQRHSFVQGGAEVVQAFPINGGSHDESRGNFDDVKIDDQSSVNSHASSFSSIGDIVSSQRSVRNVDEDEMETNSVVSADSIQGNMGFAIAQPNDPIRVPTSYQDGTSVSSISLVSEMQIKDGYKSVQGGPEDVHALGVQIVADSSLNSSSSIVSDDSQGVTSKESSDLSSHPTLYKPNLSASFNINGEVTSRTFNVYETSGGSLSCGLHATYGDVQEGVYVLGKHLDKRNELADKVIKCSQNSVIREYALSVIGEYSDKVDSLPKGFSVDLKILARKYDEDMKSNRVKIQTIEKSFPKEIRLLMKDDPSLIEKLIGFVSTKDNFEYKDDELPGLKFNDAQHTKFDALVDSLIASKKQVETLKKNVVDDFIGTPQYSIFKAHVARNGYALVSEELAMLFLADQIPKDSSNQKSLCILDESADYIKLYSLNPDNDLGDGNDAQNVFVHHQGDGGFHFSRMFPVK